MSSDTAAGLLDSIDGALRDFETSRDAMRWVPEDDRDACVRPALPSPWIPLDGAVLGGDTLDVHVDVAALTRAMSEFASAAHRALRPVVEDTARQFHALSAALFPYQHRRCQTCYPWRKPTPLAVDGHEYRRRQRARRRRHRR